MNTRRVMDGVGDGRCNASKPDLTDTSRSGWIQFVIGVFQKRDLYLGTVSVDRHSTCAYIAVTPTSKGKTIWREPGSDSDYNSAK